MASQSVAKIILLIAGIVFNHFALTAPNPSPHPEERAKYNSSNGTHESGPFTVLHAAALLQQLYHILYAAEALVILAALYPLSFGFVHWTRIPTEPTMVSSIGVTTSFVAGFILMATGASLRVMAYRQLGQNFTFQLAVRKEHKLVTSGLYSIVRHPSYTGALLFLYGTAICQIGPGSYWVASGMWGRVVGQIYGAIYISCIVYITVVIPFRSRQEDIILRSEFQEQWDTWASDTRYRLIPYIY